MTWTYTEDPSTSDRDAIRFLIQDTDSGTQLLQDEEIDWTLTQETNVYNAAALCARTLSGRFAKKATSKSVDGLSLSWASKAAEYNDLADNLERQGMRRTMGAPYMGGKTISDKQADQEDDDMVQPSIFRGITDDRQSNIDPTPTDHGNPWEIN